MADNNTVRLYNTILSRDREPQHTNNHLTVAMVDMAINSQLMAAMAATVDMATNSQLMAAMEATAATGAMLNPSMEATATSNPFSTAAMEVITSSL